MMLPKLKMIEEEEPQLHIEWNESFKEIPVSYTHLDCQRIDVLVSDEFGKFLALDGEILFSEKDEFIYDEMVTHIPVSYTHLDVYKRQRCTWTYISL